MNKYIYRKKPLQEGEDFRSVIFRKHPYDLDIRNVLQQAQIDVKEKELINKSIVANYLKVVNDIINFYCERQNISFNNNPFIIISGKDPFYTMAMSMVLSHYDPIKINAFLKYQELKYSGKGNFSDLVEHNVYDLIKHNSPFKNKDIVLSQIMNWIYNKKKIELLNEKINQNNIGLNKWDGIIKYDQHDANHINKRISMPAIAYIYNYLSVRELKLIINTQNCSSIAAQFDYTSPNSGHKLLQYCYDYRNRFDRIYYKIDNKRSEFQLNNRFNEVFAYLIEKNNKGKALEEFKQDYQEFLKSGLKYVTKEDYIQL